MARRHRRCSCSGVAKSPPCIVYVLKNSDDPPRFYTGVTADLVEGLAGGLHLRNQRLSVETVERMLIALHEGIGDRILLVHKPCGARRWAPP